MPFSPGRLKHIGIVHLRDVALNLPIRVEDYTNHRDVFDPRNIVPNSMLVLSGHVKCQPQINRSTKKRRTIFSISDGENTAIFTIYGDTRDIIRRYPVNAPIVVKGRTSFYGGRLSLEDAQIVPKEYQGKLISVYKGKANKLSALTARSLIQSHIKPAIIEASDYIIALINQLPLSNTDIERTLGYPIDQIADNLSQLHTPTSVYAYECALRRVRLLSAFLMFHHGFTSPPAPQKSTSFMSANYVQLTHYIPFSLSSTQKLISGRIIQQVRRGIRVNSVLLGDKGAGKSMISMLVVAYFAWAGKRVGVSVPNMSRAKTLMRDFNRFFSWMTVAPFAEREAVSKDVGPNVLIGTASQINKDLASFDLIIAHEPQGLSGSQREALRAANVHYIEVLSVSLPHSIALMTHTHMDVHRVRRQFAERHIETRLRYGDHRRPMFEEVIQDVNANRGVLVICPKSYSNKTNRTVSAMSDTVSKFLSYCPDSVNCAHQGQDNTQNALAIHAFNQRKKPVLITTLVNNLSQTFPELRKVIVVEPERFSLIELHHIRNQIAFAGGKGSMELYCPNTLSVDAIKYIKQLCSTDDGFRITENELRKNGLTTIKNRFLKNGVDPSIFKQLSVSYSDLEALALNYHKEITQHAS